MAWAPGLVLVSGLGWGSAWVLVSALALGWGSALALALGSELVLALGWESGWVLVSALGWDSALETDSATVRASGLAPAPPLNLRRQCPHKQLEAHRKM